MAGEGVTGLDHVALAELPLSGAHIRNIALAAAFLAATDGTRVGMRHIRSATQHEMHKAGRPISLTRLERST